MFRRNITNRWHILLIKLMEPTNKQDSSTDYAVAKALNDCVLGLFQAIDTYQGTHELGNLDPKAFNRSYILLVDELEKIYSRNPKLAVIEPEPAWKHFEFIKGSFSGISKYIERNNDGYLHRDRVEKLCITTGNESLIFSRKQKELIDFSNTLVANYHQTLVSAIEKLPKSDEVEQKNDFYIPEYRLTYKPDGTILINNVLKLKKVHAGSTTERLLEEAIKNPNTLFKPNLGQTSRNISTILSSAGFTPTMRELFFPIVSDDKGILFRPIVTFDDVVADRIYVKELNDKLFALGDIPHLFPYDGEDEDDDLHPNISN